MNKGSTDDQIKQREDSKLKKIELTQKKKEEYAESTRKALENKRKGEEIMKALALKKQGSNLSYHITFAVLGAICLYVVAMMFFNQAPPLNKVNVLDEQKIQEHNDNSFWKQGVNEFFEGSTLADAKKLINVGFASHQNLNRCQIDDSITPPDNFFYKDAFPNCVIPTYDMTKQCGSSYAFTIAQTIAERNCIANGLDKATPLSAQELLKCDIMNNGCKNGHLNLSFDHIRSKGLVEESCLPYKPLAEKCEGMCENPIRTRIDSYCLLIGEDDIKRDIMKNGPVVSSMNVHVDFLNYKSGVYTKGDEVARFSGQHAVRIVGWGVESGNDNEQNKGNKYWIIQNTWGKTWGENGFAKISFGQDLFFDQYAYSAKIKSPITLEGASFTTGEENSNLDLEDDKDATS